MGLFSGGEVSRDEFERLARRVEQLERTMAELALQQGVAAVPAVVPPTPDGSLEARISGPDLTEVMVLKQQGKVIQAIKAYRELTGVGLKEAKESVERL